MEITLESGAQFTASDARFEDADGLLKALLKCAKDFPVAPDLMKMDVGILKGPLIEAATSRDVSALLFKCFNVCTYEKVRVTKELFDDPKLGRQARRDYFQMAWEVIRLNCGPFLEQMPSWLKALRPTAVTTPEPKSDSTPR